MSSDPPEHPLDGAYYGVQAGATGGWNGHDGEFARRIGTAWQFTAVADGDQYLFNAIRSLDGTMKPLRGARPWLQHGGQWHPVGAVYEHDGSGWALAEDQDAGPDLITTYGHAQAGDYVGPWIWNELQAAICLLHVIKANSSSWGGLAALKQAGVSEWHDTWEEAKTDGLANWIGGDPPEESPEGWNYPGPTCYNLSYHTGWGYSATMQRLHRKQQLLFQAGDPPIKCDVSFYIIGAPLDFGEEINEFHAMGDAIGQTASLWHEDSGVDNASEFDSPLWEAARTNVSPQPWCTDPTGTSDEPLTTKGYVTEGSFGVKEFAVVGGFVYQ